MAKAAVKRIKQRAEKKSKEFEESYFIASQWQLIGRKFRKHKLALVGITILGLLYIGAIFGPFFSINNLHERRADYVYYPPQKIHFIDADGRFHFRPFVYNSIQTEDPVTWRKVYEEDRSTRYPIKLFTRGFEYELFGVFQSNLHFLGVEEPGIFLPFGTDDLGRCLYSRNIMASRITLSVGFLGVIISFTLGQYSGRNFGLFRRNSGPCHPASD